MVQVADKPGQNVLKKFLPGKAWKEQDFSWKPGDVKAPHRKATSPWAHECRLGSTLQGQVHSHVGLLSRPHGDCFLALLRSAAEGWRTLWVSVFRAQSFSSGITVHFEEQ